MKFLRRAVDLSRQSLEAGGFPVAAVLVRNDQEIAHGLSCTEASHDVTAHGEIQAIRAAGSKAVAPLTLYTSLEPCLMCLAASAWAGVTQIVFGCKQRVVDSSYYVTRVDAQEAGKSLVAPPEFLFIPDFQDEVVSLITEYEKRLTVKSRLA